MVNIKKTGWTAQGVKGCCHRRFFLAEVLAPNPPSGTAFVGTGQEPCGDNAAKGYKLPDKRRKKQFGISGMAAAYQRLRKKNTAYQNHLDMPEKLYFSF